MKIAIAGNPNSGKSTIFNLLTGSKQHVANYTGITVEFLKGQLYINGKEHEVIDLPGCYSLTPYAQDEAIASNFLIRQAPDLIINVMDVSSLERSLHLSISFIEMGIPVIVCLNMLDEIKEQGVKIDVEKLEQALGVPVIKTIAKKKHGIEELKKEIELFEEKHGVSTLEVDYGADVEAAIYHITEELKNLRNVLPLHLRHLNPRWLALRTIIKDPEVYDHLGNENNKFTQKIHAKITQLESHLKKTTGEKIEDVLFDYRAGFIHSMLGGFYSKDLDKKTMSDSLDNILTHKYFGFGFMLIFLWTAYHAVFTISDFPIAWMQALFAWIHRLASANIENELLKSLFVSGIIDGVGGVLGFVPLIMVMFFIISIIEDSGYMARIAFNLDKAMRLFGLHGNSILSFIVSGGILGGCAVPGIIAARTLKDRRERLATILTVPFMNCGAKLPVYSVLIAAFFPAHKGLILLLLTIISWMTALVIASILRRTLLKGETSPFIMELPPYRKPVFQGLLIHSWERSWHYIKKAGTLILLASIIMWALMTFPKYDANPEQRLEGSFAGRLGKKLEYLSKPLMGFDWKTDIALLSGLAAKEIFISTMATAHSINGESEDGAKQLSSALSADKNWSPMVGFAALVFIMLYIPCVASIAVIRRETGSWFWAAIAAINNTVVAAIAATIIYQIGLLIS